MKFIDPYYDEELGELRNLLNAKTAKEFRELEPQIVFANELELESTNIPRTNDLNELLAIHKQLFGNVYDWAGQIRMVDIRKNVDNADYFLIVSKIRDATDYVFGELAKEDCLQNLNRKTFIKRLAYFYDQLNYVHPFREGNGRTQRVFWGRVARGAGYELDWSVVSAEENDFASSLAAETMDYSALEKMFDKVVKMLANN
jgi:cell filamentation protein